MHTDIFGVIVAFENLKPGELFVLNINESAVFGIAVKFPNDNEKTFCVMLNESHNKSFNVAKFASNETVCKVDGAIIRPKIKSGTLKLVSEPTLGALILAADGTYLTCKRDDSIEPINLNSGLISTPASQCMMTTSWEIGIRDSKTQEWQTLYQTEI
jgi:hypothetical protein